MAAKKDKMIPSEKERKRALKYATPAGTGRMWVTMGIAFIIFGIILPLIPIGLVISEASAQRYDPESIHTATLVFYLLGAFFGFCGCFCVIFGKLAVKAFAKILCKGEINYPVAEYKTPKKLLLQEAAAISQSPNAPLTASTFGNWIDFEADWQNCLSIHNGILQSHQIFKKLILVQDNFTYKELDYESNSELGIGVKTFAAGSTTTIGKMKGHKLIYNIGINLSNGKLGVNSYSIDTTERKRIAAYYPDLDSISDWPVLLSEWKLAKNVREITDYQAKRFAKTLSATQKNEQFLSMLHNRANRIQ